MAAMKYQINFSHSHWRQVFGWPGRPILESSIKWGPSLAYAYSRVIYIGMLVAWEKLSSNKTHIHIGWHRIYRTHKWAAQFQFSSKFLFWNGALQHPDWDFLWFPLICPINVVVDWFITLRFLKMIKIRFLQVTSLSWLPHESLMFF